jgi:lipoprotein-anchoring transpeptidase ErfK/SrfK
MQVGRYKSTIRCGRLQPSVPVNGFSTKAGVSSSIWRIAILTAAGAIGASSYADAAAFWSDSDPGFSRPVRTVQHRRQRSHQPSVARAQPAEKEKDTAKPEGPVIIAISIEKQKMRIYDANGFFVESPVSTGMAGHPTPMGVFSVIEKDRYHHSNIYSGAPMPFMQRITWSGVAMHAGVLPGYPASHGCIRLPMAFAMKLWNYTKMGARVVITPGEMTPAAFSHPLLATQKVVPQPVAAVSVTDKTANADMALKPSLSGSDNSKPVVTADASNGMPASRTPVTMSDAGGAASPREQAVADSAPSVAEPTAAAKTSDAAGGDAKPDTAKVDVEPAAKPAQMASTQDKPAEAKPEETKPVEAAAETKPVETTAADVAEKKSDETTASAQTSSEPVKTEVSAGETPKAVETKTEAKADDVKTEAPKAEAPKLAEKPDETAKAADPVASVADAKKDQSRSPDAEKAVAVTLKPGSKAALTVAVQKPRTGQIAAFVSRKDGKMYVRQNFAPLFEIPVTIAPSDRPLGTHLFTAEVDKNDSNVLHWSVVSLPASRVAERHDADDRSSRRRKNAAPVEVKVAPMVLPDGPAEALNRLNIPPEAMTRIVEAMTTGGSLLVSDQAASGETGGGTEFIVSLR